MTTQKNNSKKLETMRHSLSHVMAQAVQELYPKVNPHTKRGQSAKGAKRETSPRSGVGVKFGIGPAIENGFYYDFDNLKISDSDLKKIEKKMQHLIKQNIKFTKKIISEAEAKKTFKGQAYKLELIRDLKKESKTKKFQVSSFKFHDFVDLCKGPHVASTKEIDPKAFKLTKTAGAYWRGNEKNKMLTRIYGVAFETPKELTAYLKQLAEAEKRDHRKLGSRLNLFTFHEESPGMAFWHPKGLILWQKLVEYWREQHKEAGYEEISTPLLLKEDLWHTSRHMDSYKENMYFSEIDDKVQVLKPMNCPGGLLLYKERNHSYRELPLRVGELGLVHRHELAGVLHGLFRVRAFTQDDAHIYCTKKQIEQELKGVINLTLKFYKTFGFKDFHLELSTRPEKYTGTLKMWNEAEKILEKVLKDMKLPYQINEGDGAFYGPKIDSHLKDSIGRTWQCGTLQLDFAQPENFELEYIDEKGKKQRPVMLHRTIYGSLERFIGILIENYAGRLPVWLSPVQALVIPVGKEHRKYAEKIAEKLEVEGITAMANIENETVGKKIRHGVMQKIPYLLVVGDKEIKQKAVAVRNYNNDLGVMKLEKFITKIKTEIEKKK